MTSFSLDTGAHLQYSHAQLCSVIRNFPAPASELHLSDFTLLTQQSAIDLVRLMVQFPEIIIKTMGSQEPSNVLTYLFRLTHALNRSYIALQVIGGDEHLSRARKALYVAVRRVLKNGMRLLGLTPIERYAHCFRKLVRVRLMNFLVCERLAENFDNFPFLVFCMLK